MIKKYDKDGEVTREHMNFQDKLDNLTMQYINGMEEILIDYTYLTTQSEWNMEKIAEVRGHTLDTLGLSDDAVY